MRSSGGILFSIKPNIAVWMSTSILLSAILSPAQAIESPDKTKMRQLQQKLQTDTQQVKSDQQKLTQDREQVRQDRMEMMRIRQNMMRQRIEHKQNQHKNAAIQNKKHSESVNTPDISSKPLTDTSAESKPDTP